MSDLRLILNRILRAAPWQMAAGGALAPVEGSPDWTFQLAP